MMSVLLSIIQCMGLCSIIMLYIIIEV